MPKEMRQVYQDVLRDLMEHDGRVVMVDADLASASGSGKNFKDFPNQTVNVGISEANMISSACGMSLTGIKPFVHTFAPFASRRVFDQLYVSGAFSHNSIHVYGSEPGVWAQFNGATHTSFEDIALARTLPDVVVTAPSDAAVFEFVLRQFYQDTRLYYTSAPRKALPDIYPSNTQFELGVWPVHGNGEDGVIFTCGSLVHEAFVAKQALEKQGIHITVIDAFSFFPYDAKRIEVVAKAFTNIMVVENHNKNGGLTELVSRELAKYETINKVVSLSIDNHFGEVGSYEFLLDKYGLDAASIERSWIASFNKV